MTPPIRLGDHAWLYNDFNTVKWAIKNLEQWKRANGGWKAIYPRRISDYIFVLREGYLYCYVDGYRPTIRSVRKHSPCNPQLLAPLYEHILFNNG